MPEPTLVIARAGHRIEVVGGIRTSADRDSLRDLIAEACADAGNEPEIIVDVARAEYLDTAALTTLMGCSRKCLDTGRTLALENASEELIAQLRKTKIDQVLQAHGARIQGRRSA